MDRTEVLIKFDRILDEVEQEFLERLLDDNMLYKSMSFSRIRPPKVYIEAAENMTKDGVNAIKKICETEPESTETTGSNNSPKVKDSIASSSEESNVKDSRFSNSEVTNAGSSVVEHHPSDGTEGSIPSSVDISKPSLSTGSDSRGKK